MKTDKSILTVFFLNLFFSLFELVGGIFTSSVAIISDAIHDFADAAGIGVSFILERKSKKHPDESYTYGYGRYSVLGGVLINAAVLFGSVGVIVGALGRIFNPEPINYNGVIVFAAVGTAVNFSAAYLTRGADSLNEKAVNLHMLEDVLGWVVVLIGGVIMRFTDISLIDPIMSVGVALFVSFRALKNLKEVLDLFLEKAPKNINVAQIKEHLQKIEGVIQVHHVHIRSLDGHTNSATMHIVFSGDAAKVKQTVRDELRHHGISHVTLELEAEDEICCDRHCKIEQECAHGHSHHHSHQH